MTKMANRCVRHLNVYLLNKTRLFYLLSHYVTAPLQPRGALNLCVFVLMCYMRLIAIFTPICFNLTVQNLTLLQLLYCRVNGC